MDDVVTAVIPGAGINDQDKALYQKSMLRAKHTSKPHHHWAHNNKKTFGLARIEQTILIYLYITAHWHILSLQNGTKFKQRCSWDLFIVYTKVETDSDSEAPL